MASFCVACSSPVGHAALPLGGAPSARAERPYAVIANFGDWSSPASQPGAGVVQGRDGAFYGTTVYGGIADASYPLGCGAIYRVTSGGKLTPQHEFTCTQGAGPEAELLAASDGLLYGSTLDGEGRSSRGLIFSIAPSGRGFRVLHYFGRRHDGSEPRAALIELRDGKLYGTTLAGPGPNGTGTIFRMNRDGSGYHIVHAFRLSEGEEPDVPLLQTKDGMLYGTALRGGQPSWAGTIYRAAPDGSNFAVIYRFAGYTLESPNGGLTLGPNGRLYGEALSNSGAVIFTATRSGHVQVIVDLPAEDSYPEGGLALGTDGRFYGTASGGFGTDGAVFAFEQSGEHLRQIHRFHGAPSDGAEPWGRLFQSPTDGRFYGTTVAGGTGACEQFSPPGCGTVFSFNP
ncbi:MAG TPA: choice-of-anchor tandem repeat GloVer-containing protein [Candidatus Cybelea sp.]